MRTLFETARPVIDRELTDMTGITTYALPDSSALVDLLDGRGRLYASRADLKTMCEESRRRTGTDHLVELLPDGPDFIEHIPDRIRELPALLQVESDLLTGTVESLQVVDRTISRMGRGRLTSAPMFPALVAYVGEAIRRTTGAQWELRLSADGQVWEPTLIMPDHTVCPILGIYKRLYEEGGKASLFAFAKVRVGDWRVSK